MSLGYSHASRCARVGKAPSHPDSGTQQFLNTSIRRRRPFCNVSSETTWSLSTPRRKESAVGEFKNAGQELRVPKSGVPETALVHDSSPRLGRQSDNRTVSMIWGTTRHRGSNVGCATQPAITPRVCCGLDSYDGGGPQLGKQRYPDVNATCSSLPMRAVATGIVHAPGSTDCNSSPMRRVCASTGDAISRPGTSKWNKIEPTRLFCHITDRIGRGKPAT